VIIDRDHPADRCRRREPDCQGMTETTGRTGDRDHGPRPRPGGWPPFAGAADAPPRRARGLVLHCLRLVAGWGAASPGIPAVGPLIAAAVGPLILAAVGPLILAAVGPSILAAVGPLILAAVGPLILAAVGPLILAAVGPRIAAAVFRSAPGQPGPGAPVANQSLCSAHRVPLPG
jgi:hypothetical protein